MKKPTFEQIIIPEFIFTDGSVGVFVGFDRTCCPDSGEDTPSWLWEMGVFDIKGNYFTIKIDTRKKNQKKDVTFLLGGIAYRHPITHFYTIGGKVNPTNGHLLPHNNCAECFAYAELDYKLAKSPQGAA